MLLKWRAVALFSSALARIHLTVFDEEFKHNQTPAKPDERQLKPTEIIKQI